MQFSPVINTMNNVNEGNALFLLSKPTLKHNKVDYSIEYNTIKFLVLY